jgi:hypothetical protein
MNGRVAAFRINGDFANPIDANYRIRIEIVRLVGHAIASWIPVDGAAPVCINSAIVNACISVEVSHDVEVIDGTRRPSTIAEPNTRHCYTRRGGVGDYVAGGIQQPGLSRNRESAAGSSSKGRDSTAIGSRAKENTEGQEHNVHYFRVIPRPLRLKALLIGQQKTGYLYSSAVESTSGSLLDIPCRAGWGSFQE